MMDTMACPHCGRMHEQLDEATWNQWLTNFAYTDWKDGDDGMPHPRIGDVISIEYVDREYSTIGLEAYFDAEIVLDPDWHAPRVKRYEDDDHDLVVYLSMIEVFENCNVTRIRHDAMDGHEREEP